MSFRKLSVLTSGAYFKRDTFLFFLSFFVVQIVALCKQPDPAHFLFPWEQRKRQFTSSIYTALTSSSAVSIDNRNLIATAKANGP